MLLSGAISLQPRQAGRKYWAATQAEANVQDVGQAQLHLRMPASEWMDSMTSDDKFDITAAKKLAEEISANLAALPEHSTRHAELRAEVEALMALLEGA